MKTLSKFLIEELSISVPDTSVLMGNPQNADISDDISDTFSDDYNTGNSLHKSKKKKKK